jgi:thiamine biosynthesis lipoprotein
MKSLLNRFKAMGSPCNIYLIGKDEPQLKIVAEEARSYIHRLEKKYSRYLDDSITSRINAAAGSGRATDIDTETSGLLDYADNCFKQSGGLFDITSGVLRRAWNFKSQRIPTQKEIDSLLPLIGWQKVKRTEKAVELTVAGMQIDFGGIVKEYAADAAAKYCQSAHIQHGYIDLGGDISVIGPAPNDKPWGMGICHPKNNHKAIAHIGLPSGGLATSGDYERQITIHGKSYSHLLNPITGWPAPSQNTFASVSVVANQCLIAGTVASIAMLKGAEAGKTWLENTALPYIAVLQDMSVVTNTESNLVHS